MINKTSSSLILKLLSVFIIIIGLWFNFYKYSVIGKCNDIEPYKIYPWSRPGTISNSVPKWLNIHLTSALCHIIITCLVILTNEEEIIMILFTFSHLIFTVIICCNIWNFGQTVLPIPFLLNGIPLLIANLAFWNKLKWIYWKAIYFFSITSPILLEFMLFIQAVMKILIFIFFRVEL